jgi:urease beta subunit
MYDISVSAGSSTNVSVLTISKEYLSTLSVGEHQLTARFGANRLVTFTITVKDTPASRSQFAVTNAVLSDDSAAVTFQLSSPSSTLVRFLVGIYQDGQLVAIKTAQLTVGTGSQITLTLPYRPSYTYKAFLTDAVTYLPLCSATEFLVP